MIPRLASIILCIAAIGGSARAAAITVTFAPANNIFYNLGASNPVIGTVTNPNPFPVLITSIHADSTLADLLLHVGWNVPVVPANGSYSGTVIDLMGCYFCNPPLPLLGIYSGSVSFDWHKITTNPSDPPDFVSAATPLTISVQSTPEPAEGILCLTGLLFIGMAKLLRTTSARAKSARLASEPRRF